MKIERPGFHFDDQLREVPNDPNALGAYVQGLRDALDSNTDQESKVKLLGELGGYLRVLGELDEAESCLRQSLQMVAEGRLNILLEIQQKIRLAHVLQWKRNFGESDRLFDEVITTCRQNQNAATYLDFALQHAGKNFFDQGRLLEALQLFEEVLKRRLLRRAPKDQIESTEQAIERTRTLIRTGSKDK